MNIFGRGTLLSHPDDPEENDKHYHDLTPLANNASVINTAAVTASSAYTNGKYTIADPNNLKQKVMKQEYDSASSSYQRYKGWSVKVVSMEAKITSLKVIWKHVRVFPPLQISAVPTLHVEHVTRCYPPVCCVEQ